MRRPPKRVAPGSGPGRRRAEGAPGQRNERSLSLIEDVSDVVMVLGADHAIEYVNASVERVLGYQPAELTATDAFEWVHPEDLPLTARTFTQVLGNLGTTGSVEHRLRRKDGSWLCLESRARSLRDESGAVNVVVTSRDISERKRAEEALRASEKRYRNLFDSSLSGLAVHEIVTDATGRPVDYIFLEVNRAFEELTGLRSEEVVGQRVTAVVPGIEETGLIEIYGRVALTGEAVRFEQFVKPLDKFFEIAAISTSRGQFAALFGDITQRKRAEEEVRKSEQRYRALFDVNPLPLWVFDEETLAFLEVNQAAVEHYGYSTEEFLGMTITDIRPPEDRALLRAYLSKARADRARVGHWTHRKKDGTLIDVEITSNSLRLPGRPARVVLAADVTQRRQGEEERARLAMAVEQADEAIVITDSQGTILYVNPACERISGYTRAEALGGNPRSLKSGKHDDAFYRELWATLLRGEVWRGHFINKRKDGTLFEVDATISPVRDADGTLVNYVAVERDVTHERRLEEQFLQAQKMEAVGRLAGGVAHDFNNLLGVITGYGELLRRQAPPQGDSRSKLEEILRAADRAATLTRQLLAFSRRQVLQPRILDLNLVVADMESMLRRLLGEDIDLVTVAGENLGTVKADRGQIEQVIMNLAVNARDAMPHGGRLSIETCNSKLDERYLLDHPGVQPGAYVMLAASDTGCGMDAETQSHLFEPFFTTKEPGKGTGLGLSTAYGIVNQSGGCIWASSEVGRGSTFKVYLPRLSEVRDPAGRPRRPSPAGGAETILVAEDEEMLRGLLRATLELHGYRVLVAANGEEALSLAQQHVGPIHLLVTDVVMPGIGGGEAARGLAQVRPETRVLYVSGYPDDAIVRHVVLEPGVVFLGKPFTPDDLLHKVREVLSEPEPGRPENREP